MADRRQKVKQGLGAVLRSTTERAAAQGEEPVQPAAETQARKPASSARPSDRKRAQAADTEAVSDVQGDKRHTSVYLYPAEFDMLDDLIYEMRREHGMRIPKTELWRALLHLAGGMMQDPKRVDELLSACSSVIEAEE